MQLRYLFNRNSNSLFTNSNQKKFSASGPDSRLILCGTILNWLGCRGRAMNVDFNALFDLIFTPSFFHSSGIDS